MKLARNVSQIQVSNGLPVAGHLLSTPTLKRRMANIRASAGDKDIDIDALLQKYNSGEVIQGQGCTRRCQGCGVTGHSRGTHSRLQVDLQPGLQLHLVVAAAVAGGRSNRPPPLPPPRDPPQPPLAGEEVHPHPRPHLRLDLMFQRV